VLGSTYLGELEMRKAIFAFGALALMGVMAQPLAAQ
jgi:hypothetical protein